MAGNSIKLRLHDLLFVDALGQTEVTQTRVFVVVQKDVLRLDVSMNNLVLVQVTNGF